MTEKLFTGTLNHNQNKNKKHKYTYSIGTVYVEIWPTFIAQSNCQYCSIDLWKYKLLIYQKGYTLREDSWYRMFLVSKIGTYPDQVPVCGACSGPVTLSLIFIKTLFKMWSSVLRCQYDCIVLWVSNCTYFSWLDFSCIILLYINVYERIGP